MRGRTLGDKGPGYFTRPFSSQLMRGRTLGDNLSPRRARRTLSQLMRGRTLGEQQVLPLNTVWSRNSCVGVRWGYPLPDHVAVAPMSQLMRGRTLGERCIGAKILRRRRNSCVGVRWGKQFAVEQKGEAVATHAWAYVGGDIHVILLNESQVATHAWAYVGGDTPSRDLRLRPGRNSCVGVRWGRSRSPTMPRSACRNSCVGVRWVVRGRLPISAEDVTGE